MRWETKVPFLVSTEILGFLSIFKKSQASSAFETLNSTSLSRCQGMWGPLSRWSEELEFPLWSPHRIQTSLNLVRWKTSLNSRHFREIRPYYYSGNLGIHSTWGRNFRVPLTYLLVREGSSRGACLKFALRFNRILRISSLLERIWCPMNFPWVPVLKFVFL